MADIRKRDESVGGGAVETKAPESSGRLLAPSKERVDLKLFSGRCVGNILSNCSLQLQTNSLQHNTQVD
jgi:hypothetical protein